MIYKYTSYLRCSDYCLEVDAMSLKEYWVQTNWIGFWYLAKAKIDNIIANLITGYQEKGSAAVIAFNIQSKYFPDSHWLKAHA